MKAFWGVILVLAVVAGVLLARDRMSEPEVAAAELDRIAAVPELPGPTGLQGEGGAVGTEAAGQESGTKPVEREPRASEAVDEGVSDAAEESATPDGTAHGPDLEEDEAAAGPGTAGHGAEAAARAREVAALAAQASEAEPAGTEAADGPSIVINEKWTVSGEGTAASPYVVPWDVLVSAGREYNPREGKTALPEWAAQLDGKHVRLTGFLLFPIVAADADELLVMYNQWDGCCIGIPPTPYDSVEVKLKRPASKDAWRFTYGSVTGVLRVDPYVAGKWLVSLYVLEGAELEAMGL